MPVKVLTTEKQKPRVVQFYEYAMHRLTYVEAIRWNIHVSRVEAAAEALEEQASDFALAGNPARAGYLEYWAGRVRADALVG